MMKDWTIVKSKSDKHPEFGYPMGEMMFKSQKEADDYINTSEFTDCYKLSYLEEVDAIKDGKLSP